MGSEQILSLESIIKKGKISDEYFIDKKKDYYIKNPLSLQLKTKLNFENIKKENAYYPPFINFIHHLKDNNIGIIIDGGYLSIYSPKTFKLIYKIQPPKDILVINKDYSSRILGFIEIKNNDLFLWTSRIILIYKKLENTYKLLQTINEFEQGTNCIKRIDYYDDDDYYYYEEIEKNKKEIYCYELNSLYELRNEIIVSCNSYGLKFYYKKNGEYILISKKQISYTVENVLEIKSNILILFKKDSKTYESEDTLPPTSSTTNYYKITIYDIEKDEEKLLIESEEYFSTFSRNYFRVNSKINYFIKNKYLFIRYPGKLNIYDLSQNIKCIFDDKQTYHTKKSIFGEQNVFKNEMEIKFLCNYFNNLFIVKDLVNEKIKLYQFKDEKLIYFNDFPAQGFNEIFKLKDNTFLLKFEHKIEIWEIK